MSAVVEAVKVLAESLEQAIDPVSSDPIVFPFHFMTDTEANKFFDKKTDYLFWMEAPLRAKRTTGIGTVDVHYALRIFIARKSKLALNQEQRQPYIDALEVAVNEFILKASQDDSGFVVIGDIQTNEVHNDFDLTADGWYINMSVMIEDVIDC